MKKVIVMLACVLAIGAASAQGNIPVGEYYVTNKSELTESSIRQEISTWNGEITTENAETEHAGMMPPEVDTSEMMDLIAQWLMLQTSNEEQRAIAGAIPARVTIEGTQITIFDDKDSTMNVYEATEVNNADRQWLFRCKDNKQVRLSIQSDGVYILSVPDMKPIKLRKTHS